MYASKAVRDFFHRFGSLWSSTLATHQADCIPDRMSGRRPDSSTLTILICLKCSPTLSLYGCRQDVRCQLGNRFTHNFTSGTQEHTTRVRLSPTSFRPFLFLAHHLSPRPLSHFQAYTGSSRHENIIIKQIVRAPYMQIYTYTRQQFLIFSSDDFWLLSPQFSHLNTSLFNRVTQYDVYALKYLKKYFRFSAGFQRNPSRLGLVKVLLREEVQSPGP